MFLSLVIKDCFNPLYHPENPHREPVKSPLEIFKSALLKDLEATITLQNHRKTYLRDQLVDSTQQELNHPSILESIPPGIDYASSKVKFFPFNAEGVADFGWGCAWRSIQTCLATGNIDITLEELFHLFGKDEVLKFLYRDRNKGWELFNDQPFAPYDLLKGWAEPFIGQMALHFFGRSAELESINQIPENCNAPKEVFHNDPLSFQSFANRLVAHFNRNEPLPVMLDNGSYSFCIAGVGHNDHKMTLWIADPHIKPGASQAELKHGICGVYTMSFDEEGRQLACSLDYEDKDQLRLMSSKRYKSIAFDQMHWMALFPL